MKAARNGKHLRSSRTAVENKRRSLSFMRYSAQHGTQDPVHTGMIKKLLARFGLGAK